MSKQLDKHSLELPQFLLKATLGCSIVVILLLIPFLYNSIIEQQIVISLFIFAIISLCSVNAWYGFNGKYHLDLNTYFVSPIGAITVIYAIYALGEVASYWPFLITLSFYFVLPQQRAVIFNVLTLIGVVPSVWIVLDVGLAARFSAALIGTNLFAFLSMREVYELHRMLHEQAIKDHLTGLFNRSTLNDALQHAIAQHHRSGMPMTILSFDIDHFKLINDTHGHAVGDQVLKQLASLVAQRTRESDRVFRIGGEEFLLLAYNTNQKQAVEIAESLRQQVEQTIKGEEKPVTLSFGVAEFHNSMNQTSWMKASDDKLYLAKRNGRNQVVV